MMTRVGIDPKWTGGSIRMAASSKAPRRRTRARIHYAGGEVAIVRDVECILQSFMLPTRERPHFCFGHRLAHLFAASARFFACSASQLLAGPPMFGPFSNNKVVQTKGQTSRAVAKAG
jgi:hypothetical protein